MDILKLGVITDIHNNFTALKVVVERLQQLECDADDVIKVIDEINYPDADNIKNFFYGTW